MMNNTSSVVVILDSFLSIFGAFWVKLRDFAGLHVFIDPIKIGVKYCLDPSGV